MSAFVGKWGSFAAASVWRKTRRIPPHAESTRKQQQQLGRRWTWRRNRAYSSSYSNPRPSPTGEEGEAPPQSSSNVWVRRKRGMKTKGVSRFYVRVPAISGPLLLNTRRRLSAVYHTEKCTVHIPHMSKNAREIASQAKWKTGLAGAKVCVA